MRYYQCDCGNVLYFENSLCLQCEREVGYVPSRDAMTLVGVPGETWKRCENGTDHGVCNWLLPASSNQPHCPACDLNRTIPDLTQPGNLEAWHKVEVAKRRCLYTLRQLRLPLVSWNDAPEHGLAFDFLRAAPGQSVSTGHADGVITLNLAEAEDAKRERLRESLGEPYRTLLGHFRHEMAHYYWELWFKSAPDSDPLLAGFREVFGDDREDYAASLARHYGTDTPPPPAGEFISSYAAVHPWEDWAETWAHYLHILDGLDTAKNFGLKFETIPLPFTRFPGEAVTLPAGLEWKPGEGKRYLDLLHGWVKLAPALNEIMASLGHQAFYPFVLSTPIVRKLFFVHFCVQAHAE